MKFYRFLIISPFILFLNGCIDDDYKLWGSGSSGNYTYQDIKRENAGKDLLTVVFTNQSHIDQQSAEGFVIEGLAGRYENEKPDHEVRFTTNPIDATTSTTKLVVQFDMAINILPQKLCNTTTPLAYRDIEDNAPIRMALVYCKYDKAQAWIRGESLKTSKVDAELIKIIARNSLNRMTMPSFSNNNNHNK